MLVIKSRYHLRLDHLKAMHADFVRQAAQGVLIVPAGFEIVDVDALDDPDLIVLIQEKDREESEWEG